MTDFFGNACNAQRGEISPHFVAINTNYLVTEELPVNRLAVVNFFRYVETKMVFVAENIIGYVRSQIVEFSIRAGTIGNPHDRVGHSVALRSFLYILRFLPSADRRNPKEILQQEVSYRAIQSCQYDESHHTGVFPLKCSGQVQDIFS